MVGTRAAITRRRGAPWGFIVALTTMACSVSPVVNIAPDPSPLVKAAALMRRGCYRCLESAFDAVVGRSPEMTFEVAALLVLRSKELGLPPDLWLDRPPRVPPSHP